jgi:hypothetical protein
MQMQTRAVHGACRMNGFFYGRCQEREGRGFPQE